MTMEVIGIAANGTLSVFLVMGIIIAATYFINKF